MRDTYCLFPGTVDYLIMHRGELSNFSMHYEIINCTVVVSNPNRPHVESENESAVVQKSVPYFGLQLMRERTVTR